MNTSLIQFALTTIAGSVLLINGVLVNTDGVIASAHSAVNGANIHQLATILELYYLDNDHYPNVVGGQALFDELDRAGLIQRRPYDPDIFDYTPVRGGRAYTLGLN